MRIATTHRPPFTPPSPFDTHKATRSLLFALLAALVLAVHGCAPEPSPAFDGDVALRLAERQMSFGPRIVGTPSHAEARMWILKTLEGLGWETTVHTTTYRGVQLNNLVAKRGASDRGPIVIGAHYDTRPKADRDPVDPELPVPGANDGASGVAVLLELARILPADLGEQEVWLAFFDGEDSGGLNGWEWSAGAAAFAADLTVTPQAVIIVDMVGDAALRIPREATSDVGLLDEIWSIADNLGAEGFVHEIGVPIIDDHRPFLERGIPAVDLIGLPYAYWHTTADTLDKLSAESLEQVGRVVQAWILSRR
jgi:glutaminyl-peptide cyclotransferase